MQQEGEANGEVYVLIPEQPDGLSVHVPRTDATDHEEVDGLAKIHWKRTAILSSSESGWMERARLSGARPRSSMTASRSQRLHPRLHAPRGQGHAPASGTRRQNFRPYSGQSEHPGRGSLPSHQCGNRSSLRAAIPVRRSRCRWCDPDVRGRNREDGGRALKRGAPDQLPPTWGWPPDLASSQPASPRVGGERQAHVAMFFKKRLFGISATGIPLFRPFAVGLRRKSTAGRASKRTCLAQSLYAPITQSYQSTLSSFAGRDCPKRSKGWP